MLRQQPSQVQSLPTQSQHHDPALLQKCYGLIEELVDRDYAQPRDIQELGAQMHSYAQG